MRAFAKLIMRGRLQAIAVAFVGGLLLPYVSLAVIGLVTLRKGVQEGALVLVCALLPILLLAQPGISLAAVVALFVTMLVIAAVLRITNSWPQTLIAIVGLSALFWLMMESLTGAGELTAQLRDQLVLIMGEGDESSPWLKILRDYSEPEWAAIFASVMALELMFCLMLSRMWQAMLYNPGGLRIELHRLRLSRLQAVLLVGLVLMCTMLGESWQLWINILALPLFVAGVTLVHWLVAKRKMGLQTLIMFYLGLIVVLPLFIPMLVVIAFTDSIVDVRRYLDRKP